MKILVLNCGSSSLKYQLIDMTDESVIAKGLVERIGEKEALVAYEPAGRDKIKETMDLPNHEVAIQVVLNKLVDAETGVVASLDEINAIGHRVVHGGEKFFQSVVITDEVLAEIEECIELAPLHNPANLSGIRACAELMPSKKQVAVFDTAFHQTLPEKAYIYGVPYEYYEKYKVRRYGFHGTSHKYVSQKAAEFVGKPIEELKIVTCHLGNGASIAAIDGGKVVETSMGFTPLEGLLMGTRSGDIDPSVVTFLMQKENLTAKQMDDVLNKKSGILGLSGISNDYRDIEDGMKEDNARCHLVNDKFIHMVRKYIGSYIAVMNGIDVLVFTAGLGENGKEVREEICTGLDFFGIKMDLEKNNCRGKLVNVSTADATVQTLIVPTNEELMIARDTNELV